MDKKENISSNLTLFYKFIFPAITIGGFGYTTIVTFAMGLEVKWIFLISWIFSSIFIWWGCIDLKKISIENRYLIISNYFKKTMVAISDIEEVSENIYLNIHPIWIKFKNPTIFGNRIKFMPRTSFEFFKEHKIAKKLRKLTEDIEYKN